MTLGSDVSYPPYQFVDGYGEPAGFDVEVAQAATELMGLKVRIHTGLWEALRTELDQQRIDGVVGMFRSVDRARRVDFSHPYLQVHHRLFVRKDSGLQSLEQAAGKRIVVQSSDLMHDFLSKRHIPVLAAATPDAALRGLSAGRYDAALLAYLQGLYLLREYRIDDLDAVGEPLFPTRKCLALAKGHEPILALINEGLAALQNSGHYDEIYDKWFGVGNAIASAEKRTLWLVAILTGVSALSLIFLLVTGLRSRRIERRLAREIEHHRSIAMSDPLTGLGNRHLVRERYAHAREGTRHGQGDIALLLIDLDGFKAVNDTFGHQAGDEALRAVARFISSSVRSSDTVARLGGDEFIIILHNAAAAEAATLAEAVISGIAALALPAGNQIRLGASIGIEIVPADGTDDLDELIRKADKAMYRAKNRGRNSYGFYEPEPC
ncbi:MAG: diguanylate cyclase [Methylococcus sp.]|nr:diguanylate cyclase [Methylococcus sp.]